ncbi:inorganic phosphate transporter [Limnofasciculus baicalensis]|uniref:Phosphate transporter n=1 Tax=Limnofasciculus baicalensis BBK-W-15 TaxID=2699891 RepID=A0AAE3KLX0_9CYAN|nr:inorganic phosphate transporter [Limnofasciculus baicalensis]MCP2728116.1 inorganic phosphate transporter [Limnofasciculus baicalensis BBK-W-15]
MLPIVLTGILAFYVAWNLGANDVANSMGTSVGSKAITLGQALVIAGILEFSGAILFGSKVSQTLATEIVNPTLFAAQPQLLVLGMIAVLLAGGVWLQIATSQGWPVSSSHAVVGAIAGFSWVAAGVGAVDWGNIGRISITWVLTPVVSGIIAAGFYSVIKYSILDKPNPIHQLREWIPWLSAIVLSIFGIIVLPTIFDAPLFAAIPFPKHDLSIATGVIGVVALTFISWHQLESQKSEISAPLPTPKNLFSSPVERLLAQFQVLSACFVAFAHGSNDVGNAIAPLATIVYIIRTDSVPISSFGVPLWILLLGGCGIVAGLAIWGKKVIATIGENIIPLQPSSGFCAEIATATTVLIASKLGFPVSTSHALVGGVVGIGLIQNWRNVRFSTIKSIALAWVITLPFAAGLGAAIFVCLRFIFG